jgi:hypothetical protein
MATVAEVSEGINTILAQVASNRSSSPSSSTGLAPADEEALLKQWNTAITSLRKAEEGISTTRLKQMSQTLKYRLEEAKLAKEYAKIDSSDRQAVYNGQVKLQLGREKNIARYYEKTRMHDQEIVQMAEEKARKAKGQDKLLAAWEVWAKPQKFLGVDKPTMLRDDPAYAATLLQVMNAVNRENGNVKLFAVDDDTGLVDIEATRDTQSYRQMNPETRGDLDDTLTAYNLLRAKQNQQAAMLDQQKGEGEKRMQAAAAALASGKNREFDRLIELEKDKSSSAQLKFEADEGLVSQAEADAVIESADKRTESAEEAREIIEYVEGRLGADGERKFESGLAKGISNEGFRAWAADHGYDRLGRVQMGKDGKPDLSTYVEGGDDVTALLAWKKQSLRRAGNYGLRGIDTGEIWSIELNDGTLITGRRLKRHAADPMGAIRIVTADGARVITPQETNQASILQRPPPSVSANDRRAKRLYNQDVARGTYARLEGAALSSSGLQNEEMLYRDADGKFYTNRETGEYLRQDEMEARRIRAGKGSPFQFTDDGTPYVIDPESASVYKVTGAGLEKVDEEVANAVIAKVPAGGERRLLVTGEGDDQRLVSSGDLEAAVGSAEKADLIGFPDTPEEKARVEGLVAASMTPTGMGYDVTEQSPPKVIRGEGEMRVGFFMVEPTDDAREISDEEILNWNNAMDKVQMDEMVDASGDDEGTSWGVMDLPEKTNLAPEPAVEPAPEPAVEPAPEPAPEPVNAQEAASRALKESQAGQPTSQERRPKGGTPEARASDAANRLKLAGKDKGTAQQAVPMSQPTASGSGGITDAGAMSMTIGEGVLDPPTDVPTKEKSDASITDDVNVGGVPNLVGAFTNMLRKKRERKKEKEATTKPKTEDSPGPDAQTTTSTVPGKDGVAGDNGAAEKAKEAKKAKKDKDAEDARNAQLAAAISAVGK